MADQIEFTQARSTNFSVHINELPYITYYTTDVMIPGINLAGTKIQAPTGSVPISDNKIEYDPITLGFIVDENYNSFKEAYQWMIKHGSPTSGRLSNSEIPEITIHVAALDSNKNPTVVFKFIDVHPVSIGEITFNSQGDNEVVTCDLTCMYTYMEVETKTTEFPEYFFQIKQNLIPA